MNRTRITFDFDIIGDERRKSYDRLVQIICASRWGSGIDIFGFLNDKHRLLFNFIEHGAIVIDECEYGFQEPCADSETARSIKSMLGKRNNHPVLREMAALFHGEPFEVSDYYRNTIYFPNLKAFARADGIKPEIIAEMLALRGCDKIILFPYFPLDGKTAYYELTLAVEKVSFVDYMNRYEQSHVDRMYEAVMQMGEQCIMEHEDEICKEEKPDWKIGEQKTYRELCDSKPTDTDDERIEALLSRMWQSCAEPDES